MNLISFIYGDYIRPLICIESSFIMLNIKVSRCVITCQKNCLAFKSIMIYCINFFCASKERVFAIFYSCICIKFSCFNLDKVA